MFPLQDLKIIEWGTHVAVPSSVRLLADFGASVIKIEALDGDPYRSFGDQYSTPIEDGYNPFFTMHNNGKRLLSLDLKKEKGRQILLSLLEHADVFVTSVRSASLKALGLDYETIKEAYPRLIYYHFTGFGLTGPDAERPGFDATAFWARCGALIDTVQEGYFPLHPSQAMGDLCSGAMIAYGVLTALRGRDLTGQGAFVSSSLFGSGVYYNCAGIISSQEKYHKPFPIDRFTPENPFRHYYLCKDGQWILMAAQSYNKRWQDLCTLFQFEDWRNDPDYMTEEAARKAGLLPQIVRRLNEIFLTKTRDEWAEIFEREDYAYEKLVHFKDVHNDPQAWDCDYLCHVRFRGTEDVTMPNSPVQISGFEKRSYEPLQGIGQHTAEVLSSLGYSEAQRLELSAAGVVR